MNNLSLAKPMLIFLGEFPEVSALQSFLSFKDWEERRPVESCVSGFYLQVDGEGAWQESLKSIRRSVWWNLPVFAKPDAKSAAPYVDGLCSGEQAREIAQGMVFRRQSLPDPAEFVGLEERLLFFLYERGLQVGLQPLLDRNSAQLYRYPVADLLAFEHEDASRMVDILRRRGLLRDDGLLDRTRHCSSCHSAHVNFVDLCPHCEDLDIHKEPALHCFACGHVGPESLYLESGALVCPKCHVQLRHIGVDYDKPLAQYSCRSCQRSFMESLVKARCFDCGHSNSPSDLEVREVCRLQLSASGRNAIRAGNIRGSFAALKARSYVEPEMFQRMLDWANNIQARHKEFRFNVMSVELHHEAKLQQRLGSVRLYLLLDEFALRLNEKLRDSDVITRKEENSLLLLLPFTDPEGLKARIELIFKQMASEEGDVSELRLVIRNKEVTPPAKVQERQVGKSLMQSMVGLGRGMVVK